MQDLSPLWVWPKQEGCSRAAWCSCSHWQGWRHENARESVPGVAELPGHKVDEAWFCCCSVCLLLLLPLLQGGPPDGCMIITATASPQGLQRLAAAGLWFHISGDKIYWSSCCCCCLSSSSVIDASHMIQGNPVHVQRAWLLLRLQQHWCLGLYSIVVPCDRAELAASLITL